jgi:hypothetical protein
MTLDHNSGSEKLKDIPEQRIKEALWTSFANSIDGSFEASVFKSELSLPEDAELSPGDVQRIDKVKQELVDIGVCETGTDGMTVLSGDVIKLFDEQPGIESDFEAIVKALNSDGAKQQAEIKKKISDTSTNIFLRLKSATDGILISDLEKELGPLFSTEQTKNILVLLSSVHGCSIENGRYYERSRAPAVKRAEFIKKRFDEVAIALGKWLDDFPEDGLSARGCRGSLLSMVQPFLSDEELEDSLASLLLSRRIVEVGGSYYKSGFEPSAGAVGGAVDAKAEEEKRKAEAFFLAREKMQASVSAVQFLLGSVSSRSWVVGEEAPISPEEQDTLLGDLARITEAVRDIRTIGVVASPEIRKTTQSLDVFIRNDSSKNLGRLFGVPQTEDEKDQMLLRQGTLADTVNELNTWFSGLNLPASAPTVRSAPAAGLSAPGKTKAVLDAVKFRENGKQLESRKDALLNLLDTLTPGATPSDADKKQFYDYLAQFIKATDGVIASGVELSDDGARAHARFKRILQDRTVHNERLFRDSLIGIEDELFSVFQGINNQQPDPLKPIDNKPDDKVAAGTQAIDINAQRATSTPPPVGGTGTAGSSVDITTGAVAVKSAELTAAGNDLGDAYMQVSEVMRRLQSGRPVSPDDWKKAKHGLQAFLKSVAAMVAGGLKLSGDAQEAQTYLSGLNRLEDSAEIKRAMDAIEMELRTQYQGAADAGASPDTIAAKRAALTAAGNDLGDAYDMVDEVMQRLQSGRPVPADERKEARKNLLMFLDSAAAMVAGGLTLSPDAQAAQSYLESLDRLDDWAEIRRAMDVIEEELRMQYWETESTRPDEKLERVAALRAQATITKSILDAYEKANGGALSPIADLLVRRVVREVLERSEKDTVSSDPSFIRFLNQIRESTKNGNLLSILDADSGQRESITLKYIIERLVGGLNESIKKLYKERSDKLSAEGRDEDIFNREEIDTYDSFLAVGKWLAELKDEKNIDPKLRSQLVTELEKTERNLAEKLEKLRGQRYPSATPSIGRTPAEPTSFSASFDLGGKKALGGMTSSVGIDAIAGGAFAAAKPEVRKPRQNTAIDFKFKNGKYTLPMAEAFANDVFYDFFKKFDEQRNPGEEFDAADESHHERYEKAVEGYRLWMEALGVFTKQAKEIIQQDLGIKADPADFVAFEDELEQLVIEDTQKVRGMIDKISEYNRLEEDEARKENELIDLGGFEKLKIQVDELQILRQEKKFEADALIARLTDFAKSRSPYSRAREFKNRTTWQKAKVPQNEGFWAKLKRKASDATGSLMWKFKGLLTFKESRNLEKELQKTYGMDIDTAAEYFPELAKLEERMQAQTEAAIREYERIEKMYHELKSKVATVERAQQEKDLISNRFNQLRLGIFSNTQAFKTVARLTAGRSRDIIKGMLDGAGSSDEKLGEAVKKSEVQLEGLRRAANFKFGGDRYADLPEITETLGAEGSVIAEADSVITEAVKKRIQKVVEQTTTVNNQGTLLIRKAFLAYGKRGYEIGEQVLSEAIKKAKDASNGRRANQLQALLFELRALKG